MKGDKICEQARAMFLRFGIKSVSMDDLSQQIGISKKTLYQFIPNKTGLVAAVLNQHFENQKSIIEKLKKSASDPIHELVLIARHMVEMLKEISPNTMYDLKKYYAAQWQEIDRKRSDLIMEQMHNNLTNGVNCGLYREDIDVDLLATLYLRATVLVTDEEIFDRHKEKKAEIYTEFVKYHIRGIATEKGITLLNQYEQLLNE